MIWQIVVDYITFKNASAVTEFHQLVGDDGVNVVVNSGLLPGIAFGESEDNAGFTFLNQPATKCAQSILFDLDV